jgi:hypothetical protein
METGHRVTSSFCDFLHLRQLLGASCGQVQKRESVEVLRLLVGLLYNLYIKLEVFY